MKQHKKIQISLSENEYNKMHKSATAIFGDNRCADAAYIRDCIKSNKRKTKAEKDKIQSIVKIQECLNRYSRGVYDTPEKVIEYVKGEVSTLWLS